MNKLNFTFVFVLLFSFNFLTAQDHTKNHDDDNQQSDSRFSIIGFGGVGYTSVDNDNQPNYNLDASTFDILVHYRIGKRYGISTGIGFNQLTGNGFNSANQNFYHERGTIKIPLLFSANYNVSRKVRLVANIGFYGQTVVKDEYSFATTTIKDVYEGWSFGFQSGIGMSYNLNHKLSLGIMFNTQGDFTSIDSNSNAGFTDKQKIAGINTIGLLFGINL
ncbi:outer membrane beta-barrel protein [uncultured Kordia sp.]|uniref:outer membrane beta-barrel protein n=1 Tax=uncultured Kordia sp. TaxID=507699 RepID=UPI0026053D11|nr:outer membrane beta-barrel protein [uncultured Kordia sp.]